MITTYKDFLTENNVPTPEDFGISIYEWNHGKLNCFESVNLFNKELKKLPFLFGKIDGTFNCSGNEFTNLEGGPNYVEGDFGCAGNHLTSLDGCPKIVNGSFFCNSNQLSMIEDYPLCLIKGEMISLFSEFDSVFKIVKKNKEKFEPLLDNKIAFHQMVMRLDPSLIKYYTNIQPPTKRTILFQL